MTFFTLQLTSNESTFEYSFPQEFLDKKYEIGLLKLDGKLEINNKINVNQAKGLSILQSRALRLTLSGIRKLSQARKISRIHLETSKKLACDNF